MTILTRKFSDTNTQVLNLMHFQEKMVHFLFKNEPLRSESVKTPNKCFEQNKEIFKYNIILSS